eukprot:312514_1
MTYFQAIFCFIWTLLTITISTCNRSNSRLDFRYYPTLKLPVIKLFDSNNTNDLILNAMLLDEMFKNYSIAIFELDNTETQRRFDLTYEAVTNFWKNRDWGYRNSFVRSGSYYPFGKEQYTLKRQMMKQLMSDVAKTDKDYFNTTQKAEPLDSYYIFQQQNQFKFDFNDKYLQQIPKDFRKESIDVFYEFHSIFKKIMHLSSIALGFNTDIFMNNEQLLFDKYQHSLKYSHYLRLHTENQDKNIEYDKRLDICNFPYRYGVHFDVGVLTIERMDHNMQGFQIFVNDKWYNVDANDYPSNTVLAFPGKHMEYWTNGYWGASIHRVLSEYEHRIALLFFTQPDTDVIIQPINECNVCKMHDSQSQYDHVYGKTINELLQELQTQL